MGDVHPYPCDNSGCWRPHWEYESTTLGSLSIKHCCCRSLTLAPPAILNPAMLLPYHIDNHPHNCKKVLTWLRNDPIDVPLPDAEVSFFTDESNYVEHGERYADASEVNRTSALWKSILPKGTLAQKAKLVALTQALLLGNRKRINNYIDNRYAFTTEQSTRNGDS